MSQVPGGHQPGDLQPEDGGEGGGPARLSLPLWAGAEAAPGLHLHRHQELEVAGRERQQDHGHSCGDCQTSTSRSESILDFVPQFPVQSFSK